MSVLRFRTGLDHVNTLVFHPVFRVLSDAVVWKYSTRSSSNSNCNLGRQSWFWTSSKSIIRWLQRARSLVWKPSQLRNLKFVWTIEGSKVNQRKKDMGVCDILIWTFMEIIGTRTFRHCLNTSLCAPFILGNILFYQNQSTVGTSNALAILNRREPNSEAKHWWRRLEVKGWKDLAT